MSILTKPGIYLAERGWVSDRLLRGAMHRLCGKRLQQVAMTGCDRLRHLRHYDTYDITTSYNTYDTFTF